MRTTTRTTKRSVPRSIVLKSTLAMSWEPVEAADDAEVVKGILTINGPSPPFEFDVDVRL